MAHINDFVYYGLQSPFIKAIRDNNIYEFNNLCNNYIPREYMVFEYAIVTKKHGFVAACMHYKFAINYWVLSAAIRTSNIGAINYMQKNGITVAKTFINPYLDVKNINTCKYVESHGCNYILLAHWNQNIAIWEYLDTQRRLAITKESLKMCEGEYLHWLVTHLKA